MLDVCYKSSAILHVDIAQTSDSFEGKRSELDHETLLMAGTAYMTMSGRSVRDHDRCVRIYLGYTTYIFSY